MRKIVVIILLVCVWSCRSKKKIVEREAIKTEVAVNEITKTDVLIDSSATTSTETIKTDFTNTIALTQADPEKTVTIEDDKGNKLTITGANVVISDTKTTKATTEETTTNS